VVVLDVHNRLVDFNPAAEREIQWDHQPRIGEPAERTFAAWPDLLQQFYRVNDIRVELPFGDPPHQYLDLKISPLYDRRGGFLGRLVVWRDITPLKMAQSELQEQAIRDHLTGLYNRRYLGETLERELSRATRGNYPVSLVMIDIDHFKNLNDAFGHHMGDSILKSFAEQLMEQTRVEDIICRYGGEEFLVLLPNIPARGAHEIAERWRQVFQETHAFHDENHTNVTVSCGVAEFPVDGHTAEDLVAAADKSLYQAKALGRNRSSHTGMEKPDRFVCKICDRLVRRPV
jgi:diguanylate cyclase (GGDEF)-like protein